MIQHQAPIESAATPLVQDTLLRCCTSLRLHVLVWVIATTLAVVIWRQVQLSQLLTGVYVFSSWLGVVFELLLYLQVFGLVYAPLMCCVANAGLLVL